MRELDNRMLPLLCLTMTHAITQSSTPAPKLSKIPVVSIIDDDKDVREATEALLQTFGYDTVTFASAEDYRRSGYAGYVMSDQ
jgi:response regulator RpfG family c-di-GMP phosphodiesterase